MKNKGDLGTMNTSAVSHWVYLLDEAFEGTAWHSLLGNLQSVTSEDWLWVPPGGQRSIRDMVGHVGGSKFMYHNHAFGDALLTWDDQLVDGREVLSSKASSLTWLREGRRLLRQSLLALDDAELLRPRRTNWGEMKETRWIIAVMIEHDLYHAGEINHLHSLHLEHDRWQFEYEQQGS